MNVPIIVDGRRTELDLVVVNSCGVFIIEVKSYAGRLIGGENDHEWVKFKTTEAGNTYEKRVKNPIRQVRRQVYLLARYLDYYGVRTWVKGYVILLHGSSPVESDALLNSSADIDRAIHSRGRSVLDAKTIERISSLLSE